MGVFLLNVDGRLFYVKRFIMPSGGKSKSMKYAGYQIASVV